MTAEMLKAAEQEFRSQSLRGLRVDDDVRFTVKRIPDTKDAIVVAWEFSLPGKLYREQRVTTTERLIPDAAFMGRHAIASLALTTVQYPERIA